MTQHRDIAPAVATAVAYHEAGHAVAYVLAYRHARMPRFFDDDPCIKYAGIGPVDEAGNAGGMCFGTRIYARQYLIKHPDLFWGNAMAWEIVGLLAGGIAEAIHRGEHRQRHVLWFALCNCGTKDDFESAEATLADLRELTGRRYGLQRFAKRALHLLLLNWPAVEAIAAAIIRDHTIDGEAIEALVP